MGNKFHSKARWAGLIDKGNGFLNQLFRLIKLRRLLCPAFLLEKVNPLEVEVDSRLKITLKLGLEV